MDSLRRLRKEKGLSQQQLAELLDVNQTAVSQWERGVTTPSSRMLLQLSKLFRVSPNKLLSDDSTTFQWDDPEIMDAVRESFPEQLQGLNVTLQTCSDEEQKLVFNILVQLNTVLKMKDYSHKMTALSMIHDVAAGVEHLTGDSKANTNKETPQSTISESPTSQ